MCSCTSTPPLVGAGLEGICAVCGKPNEGETDAINFKLEPRPREAFSLGESEIARLCRDQTARRGSLCRVSRGSSILSRSSLLVVCRRLRLTMAERANKIVRVAFL